MGVGWAECMGGRHNFTWYSSEAKKISWGVPQLEGPISRLFCVPIFRDGTGNFLRERDGKRDKNGTKYSSKNHGFILWNVISYSFFQTVNFSIRCIGYYWWILMWWEVGTPKSFEVYYNLNLTRFIEAIWTDSCPKNAFSEQKCSEKAFFSIHFTTI